MHMHRPRWCAQAFVELKPFACQNCLAAFDRDDRGVTALSPGSLPVWVSFFNANISSFETGTRKPRTANEASADQVIKSVLLYTTQLLVQSEPHTGYDKLISCGIE
jgi:hypothetical protein